MDWVFKSPDNISIVLSMFMVLYDGKLVAVELFASSAALSNDYAVRKTYMSYCSQLGMYTGGTPYLYQGHNIIILCP
jgi:hypothetical protein